MTAPTHRLSVYGRLKRITNYAFSYETAYVWMAPQFYLAYINSPDCSVLTSTLFCVASHHLTLPCILFIYISRVTTVKLLHNSTSCTYGALHPTHLPFIIINTISLTPTSQRVFHFRFSFRFVGYGRSRKANQGVTEGKTTNIRAF